MPKSGTDEYRYWSQDTQKLIHSPQNKLEWYTTNVGYYLNDRGRLSRGRMRQLFTPALKVNPIGPTK